VFIEDRIFNLVSILPEVVQAFGVGTETKRVIPEVSG
jgi:hypothetical protein